MSAFSSTVFKSSSLVVSVLAHQVNEFFELNAAVLISFKVSFNQHGFEHIWGLANVNLCKHSAEDFLSDDSIISSIKASEQFTENELFVMVLGALLHKLESEGGHKLLDVLLVNLLVGCLLNLP
jgi:hypothetical protein